MNRKLLRGVRKYALGLVVCAGLGFSAHAADQSNQADVWRSLDQIPAEDVAAEPWIRPNRYHAFTIDPVAARALLNQAPLEGTPAAEHPLQVQVPLPDGTFANFEFIEAPVMDPALQAQFPEIRTYIGALHGDTAVWGRFDLTPAGFHGMIFTPEGTIFIDPFTKGDNTLHTSYFRADLPRTKDWTCMYNPVLDVPQEAQGVLRGAGAGPGQEASGTQLRTYRLAVACTGEYAAFHGGTQAGALAAVVTTTNRVVGVYEKDVAVRMVLVANNINLMYTNSATDPYTNGNGSAMLTQNNNTCNSVIGSANYDIGHVVSTGGGGVAFLAVVCGSNKGGGVTGSPSPVGDPFDIDYVAHEMGHQFAGNHTFNSTVCASNRNASTAYEQGSGSTVMAYAGICGSDNIQSNSDAYFHSASLDEIIAYTTVSTGNNCPVKTNTGNNIPTINAGPDFTVPRGTQYIMTPLSYGDADAGDVPNLTFTWEERDLGVATAISTADNGSSPIIRPTNPHTAPSQIAPIITNYVTPTYRTGDRPTNTTRTMKWRCVIRDNRAGGGGVNWDDINVFVNSTAGPFVVNTPVGSPFAGGTTVTLTWNVANTNVAPVNCANVRITMSGNNGSTFPYELIASTPNDGSEVVTLPNVAISAGQGRFKVEAVGNIFFDVTNGTGVAVTASSPPATPTSVGATPNPVCVGSTVTLSGSVTAGNTIDWYTGSCGGTLIGSGTSLPGVVVNSNTTYFARARNTTSGLVSVSCASVSVTTTPLPTDPSSAASDRQGFCAGDTGTISLSASGGSGTTLQWFTSSCGGVAIGTGNPLVIASPSSDTTYYARWSTACGTSNCVSVDVDVSAADITDDSAGPPDGVSDLNDFFYFLNCFDATDLCADVTGDSIVDLNDFFEFLNAFDAGC